MNNDSKITFADHAGQFYAKQYGFPPVTGRLIGYLAVCEPIEQSIADIADALLTSRTAITNAVVALETQGLITRNRPAGSRMDVIKLSTSGWEKGGFDATEYQNIANLAREGLKVLKDATPERQAALQEMEALGDFLAERMPRMYQEWQTFRAQKFNR